MRSPRYKLAVLALCVSAGPTLRGPVGAEAVNWSGYEATAVIDSVQRSYGRISSVRGRIHRSVEIGDEVQTHQGRFAARLPDHLYVEFVGEDAQIHLYDGDSLHVYWPGEKQGIRRSVDSLTSIERNVLGPAPFVGDPLSALSSGFAIEIADTTGGNLILKLVPETLTLHNFILVAVHPGTWTVRAIEFFDRNDALVSQTRFLQFAAVGDSLRLPRETVTSTVTHSGLLRETTRFSRVEMNVPLDEDVFRLRNAGEIRWLDGENH